MKGKGKEKAFDKKPFQKRGIIAGIAAAVILFAVLIGIGIYNTPANRTSRHLNLGERYLEEQNYEQAVVEFDKVIAIDPMSVEAYLGKAQAYEGMGDLDKAYETLQIGYEKTGDERLLEGIGKYEPIVWQDPVFESMIREYLGRPTGTIRASDVGEIEELIVYADYILKPGEEIKDFTYSGSYENGNVDYYFVTGTDTDEKAHTAHQGQWSSLDDIVHFKSLKTLEIIGTDLLDISGLAALTDLTHLQIRMTQVSDISALSGLTKLEYLHLEQEPIKDISALAGLENLQTLYLYTVPISDLTALSSLSQLKELLMAYNEIDDSDIEAIANLSQLEYLHIQGNQINDLTPLAAMSNLKGLVLWDDSISDISPLAGLKNLKLLSLTGNNITDYSPVSFVEDLRY